MPRCVRALSLLILLVTGAAADTTMLPGLIHTPMSVVIDLPDGRTAALEAFVIRPDRPGRYPLAVLVHGTPRGDGAAFLDKIGRMSPADLSGPALAFATHGYAVVSILRRGFGHSGGPFAERYSSPCDDRDYLRVGQASAEDMTGAVAALRHEPWVDPDRIVLLGVSTGGFAVTAAAATNPPGVVGVLSFAGGRGSVAPDKVCGADRLVADVGTFGRTARVPALWVYAENDHYFPPALAHRMFEAYTAAGAPAKLRMLPPFGPDGHMFLTFAPPEQLWSLTEGFLAALHLPVALTIALPPLAAMPAPPRLGAICEVAFRAYVAARIGAKAFAINLEGHCGWNLTAPTQDEAVRQAIRSCEGQAQGCRIYASGQELVERAN
jgi:dienelactone hydrolase